MRVCACERGREREKRCERESGVKRGRERQRKGERERESERERERERETSDDVHLDHNIGPLHFKNNILKYAKSFPK